MQPLRAWRRAPWLGDLGPTLSLSPEGMRDWAAWAFGSGPLPMRLATDRGRRMVFASAGGRVVHAAGRGIEEATRAALAALGPAPRSGAVKLDLVERVVPASVADGSALERSLYGLAFDGASGLAFLPEELVARTLVDSQGRLRMGNLERYVREDLGGDLPRDLGGRERFRFAVSGAAWDGARARPLYRGHRVVEAPDVRTLVESAALAGTYLARAVGADGRFVYSYRPKTDEAGAGYNIVRHAGSIWSMLELHRVTGDEALLEAATRALACLEGAVRPGKTRAGAEPCIVEDGLTKLGGNALAALALVEHCRATGDATRLPLVRGLGRWILAAQDSSGRFAVHKRSHPRSEIVPFESEYYPGEALLALLRIAALDADPAWLDAAEAGARWLIEVRDAAVPDAALIHDHWLLIALDELHAQRPDPLLARHALRIARVIVRAQRRFSPHRDQVGSFGQPPRSTPTATRMEGLCAALSLARRIGARDDAAQIRAALGRGVAFLLGLQFRPESALHLRERERCLGGFKRSLTHWEIRIDYVQHAISALLGMARLLSEEADDRRPE